MLIYKGHGVTVEYTDKDGSHLSSKCQPRDIRIVQVTSEGKVLKLRDKDIRQLKERIAIDMRLGQGLNPIGVAKNLLTQ